MGFYKVPYPLVLLAVLLPPPLLLLCLRFLLSRCTCVRCAVPSTFSGLVGAPPARSGIASSPSRSAGSKVRHSRCLMFDGGFNNLGQGALSCVKSVTGSTQAARPFRLRSVFVFFARKLVVCIVCLHILYCIFLCIFTAVHICVYMYVATKVTFRSHCTHFGALFLN